MKSTTLELPRLKPKTAQYLAMKSIEEQKSVFDLLVELADGRAEYEVGSPEPVKIKIEDKVDKEKLTRKDRRLMDLMEEVEGLEELEQAMLEELMLLGWDYSHSPLY